MLQTLVLLTLHSAPVPAPSDLRCSEPCPSLLFDKVLGLAPGQAAELERELLSGISVSTTDFQLQIGDALYYKGSGP